MTRPLRITPPISSIFSPNAFPKRVHFSFRAALIFLLLLVLAACAPEQKPASGQGRAESFALTILHTNDVHSAYSGLTAEGRICYEPVCAGGQGGALRLLAAVEAIRRDRPDTLFLDAGDEFQGTLYYNLHKERMASEVMNAVGYDAFTPGNHEFDDGPNTFLRLVKDLNMPILAANMRFDPPLPGAERILPWAVVERSGRRIGLVGLTTTDTARDSSPGPGVVFTPEKDALRRAVADLSAQGVDIIIAMTHMGLANDQLLARSVAGVDVIVGGHSHSLLANSADGADGPYPVVETSPSGEPVLLVTASFGGRLLGDLEVIFDARGVAVHWSGDPIVLNDERLKELKAPAFNADLTARLAEYAKPVTDLLAAPLAEIEVFDQTGGLLENPSIRICRAEECLSGDIAADALLGLPGPDAEVALVNSGGLRNSLPVGRVSMGDVLAVLPFNNYVVVSDMPGSTLLAALEHGVSDYGQDKGRFLQVAGLTYVFDPSRPAGQGIVAARVADENGNLRPLDPAAVYRVVTVDYIAKGGDGFDVLKSLAWRDTGLVFSDVLGDYLKNGSPLAPRLEGRITRR